MEADHTRSTGWRAPSLGPLRINAFAWIYTTVSVMAMLVVYDGWSELNGVGGIVLIVVGPTIALAAAHVFAEVIDELVKRDMIDARARRRLVWEFFEYVVVAVPPLVLLGITSIVLQQPPRDSIKSMLALGVFSLGFWGGLAAWRAGLRWWRLAAATSVGLLIGGSVFLLQILLKPH